MTRQERERHFGKLLSDVLYLDGTAKPHYPMPAIRLAVDICETWDKTVVIFDLDKNDIVYGVYEGDFN